MRRLPICLSALLALGVSPAVPVTAGAAARPSTGVPSVHIAAYENYFVPASPVVARGGTVSFDFDTALDHHTATDDSGLGLYNSGEVAGGGPSYLVAFAAAGTYAFYCISHPEMRGRVRVPVRVSPGRASKGEAVTVTWASVEAVSGYAYDVQIRRPGGAWTTWRDAAGVRTAPFIPHKRGTFRFRARLRDTTTQATSRWSDPEALEIA